MALKSEINTTRLMFDQFKRLINRNSVTILTVRFRKLTSNTALACLLGSMAKTH